MEAGTTKVIMPRFSHFLTLIFDQFQLLAAGCVILVRLDTTPHPTRFSEPRILIFTTSSSVCFLMLYYFSLHFYCLVWCLPHTYALILYNHPAISLKYHMTDLHASYNLLSSLSQLEDLPFTPFSSCFFSTDGKVPAFSGGKNRTAARSSVSCWAKNLPDYSALGYVKMWLKRF